MKWYVSLFGDSCYPALPNNVEADNRKEKKHIVELTNIELSTKDLQAIICKPKFLPYISKC